MSIVKIGKVVGCVCAFIAIFVFGIALGMDLVNPSLSIGVKLWSSVTAVIVTGAMVYMLNRMLKI
jgi:Mg/Co/Ni transporter MgtE